jgi:hypothetical protein
MTKCAYCGGKFGLIRHRWYAQQFCRKQCRVSYLNKLAEDRQRLMRWFSFIARSNPHDTLSSTTLTDRWHK